MRDLLYEESIRHVWGQLKCGWLENRNCCKFDRWTRPPWGLNQITLGLRGAHTQSQLGWRRGKRDPLPPLPREEGEQGPPAPAWQKRICVRVHRSLPHVMNVCQRWHTQLWKSIYLVRNCKNSCGFMPSSGQIMDVWSIVLICLIVLRMLKIILFQFGMHMKVHLNGLDALLIQASIALRATFMCMQTKREWLGLGSMRRVIELIRTTDPIFCLCPTIAY